MDEAKALSIIICVGLVYFLPTICSTSAGRKDSVQVFLTNLLLGWTFVGWCVALIWSFRPQDD